MKKILIGVTGASGSIYAKILINKILEKKQVQIGLIFSENGKKVWLYELEEDPILKYKGYQNILIYDNTNLFSEPASGSSNYDSMVIIPCTMCTIGKIANGIADNLIVRAADVFLKEKKTLILVFREMPLNYIHLKNLVEISRASGIIMPASPSFYFKPKSIEDLVCTVVDKVLIKLGLQEPKSWINNY